MSGFEKAATWLLMLAMMLSLLAIQTRMDTVIAVFKEIAVEARK